LTGTTHSAALLACDEKCRADGYAAFDTAWRASANAVCVEVFDVVTATGTTGEKCILKADTIANSGLEDTEWDKLKGACWTAVKAATPFSGTNTNAAWVAYFDAAIACIETGTTRSATGTCVAPAHVIKIEGEDIDTCVAAGTSKAALTACGTAC